MPDGFVSSETAGSPGSTEPERSVSTAGAAAGAPGRERPRAEGLRGKGAHAAGRVRAGAAGTYWSHLTGVDFLNSSFAFAALGVVSAFPFLAVVSAATGAGGGVRQAIVTRMGLNA